MDLYTKLSKKPLIFKRITGLSPQEFCEIAQKLLLLFQKKQLREKKIAGRPYSIQPIENQLLCLLMYYRTYSTQLFIGFLFSVDDSTVSRTIKRLEPLLAKIIHIKKERKMSAEQLETLILDWTEQPIQRPQTAQQTWYSGKKKRHTIKTEILITAKGKIRHVSKPHAGSVHDMEIRRREKPLPSHLEILADSGYQALQKKHKKVRIPIKKPRGKPLSEQDREKKQDALQTANIGGE